MARIRRLPPKAKVGPPWWEIAFLPLSGSDGLFGIIGRIRVIGTAPAVKPRPLPEALLQLRHRLPDRYRLDSLISEAAVCEPLLQQVRLAAQHRMPLVLIGESGTGKRWLARVIHHHGVTAEQSFLAIECGGLPGSAAAALLFGDTALGRPERTGTVYLREPAALPREVQAKLADWLRERSATSPRIVAGFRADPTAAVAAGQLLPQLQLGLSVQTISVPPLRDRADDLPRLAGLLLDRAIAAGAPACPGFASESWEFLRAYTWPGNVRELDSAIDAAARSAHGSPIDQTHWPEAIRQWVARQAAVAKTPQARHQPIVPLDTLLEHVERRMIVQAMRKAKGLHAEAAELLGIWRARLSRRLKALNVRDDEWRTGPAPEPSTDEVPSDRRV
jgi:DNA-binding NtrC family response regulator